MDARRVSLHLAFHQLYVFLLLPWTYASVDFAPRRLDGCRLRISNDLVDTEWDCIQESWLNFQVRLCGKMCNDTQYLEVQRRDMIQCSESCFLCDCEVTCPIYGTCCPQIDSSTPLAQEHISYSGDENQTGPWLFSGNLSDYTFFDANDDSQSFMSYPELRAALVFTGRFQCVPTCWNSDRPDCHYFMIATCPPSETNQTLRYLCESGLEDDVISPEFLSPMTDVRNGVTFKNMHCAKCNNYALDYSSGMESDNRLFNPQTTENAWDRHLYRWELEAKCLSYQDFYAMDSDEDFLRAVLKKTIDDSFMSHANCQVNLNIPRDLKWKPRLCHVEKEATSPLIDNDTCSKPGSTFAHDILFQLCYKLTAPAFSFDSLSNVFCFLCDNIFPTCPLIIYTDSPRGRRHPSINAYSPLAVLLGSKSGLHFSYPVVIQSVSQRFLCNDSLQWMENQGVCQLPHCPLGKSLNAITETCDSIVSNINGLRYQAVMLVIPNYLILSSNITDVHKTIADQFSHVTRGYMDVSYIVYSSDSLEEDDYVKYVKVQGPLQAVRKLTRDAFERWYLTSSLASDSEQPPFDLFNGSRIIWGHETTHAILRAKLNDTILDLILRATILDDWESTPRNVLSEGRFKNAVSLMVTLNNNPDIKVTDDLIDMNPSLLCPFVELNMSTVAFEDDNEIKIGFFYRGEEEFFNVSGRENKFSIENGKLRICIDIFRSEFQKFVVNLTHVTDDSKSLSIEVRIMMYSTYICLGISTVCLLLSVVTYALFPVLRSLAGLNTMTLCICLASAQLCLISLQALISRIEGWSCQLLGIAVHFTWLASFHWMHVCCIHMFIVFYKCQTRRVTAQAWKPYLKYSTYAFGASALYVLIQVTMVQVLTSGASFGYHPKTCTFDFQSSTLAPILTMFVPLAIVVISNIILFGLAISRIVSVRRLQGSPSNKNRDGILPYVKLSTLTGLCWLLYFLSVKLNVQVLSSFSGLLICLQGLFIFVSFTVNARVKGLYLDLFFGSAVQRSAGTSISQPSTKSSRVYNKVKRGQACPE